MSVRGGLDRAKLKAVDVAADGEGAPRSARPDEAYLVDCIAHRDGIPALAAIARFEPAQIAANPTQLIIRKADPEAAPLGIVD